VTADQAAAPSLGNSSTLAESLRELQSSNGCEEFRSNFKKFYKQARSGELSEEQRDRAKIAIALSCSDKFRSCNPQFCAKSAPVVAKVAEVSPEVKAIPNVEPSKISESVVGSAMLRGIETDKMAWLALPMSCDQFSEQVTSRYLPLGPFGSLSPEIKREVSQVLAAACSDKYRQCGFSQCQSVAVQAVGKGEVDKKGAKSSPAKNGDSKADSTRVLVEAGWGIESATVTAKRDLDPVELKQLAEGSLAKQFASYRASQKSKIRLAAERELHQGLKWQPIAMNEGGDSEPVRRERKPSTPGASIRHEGGRDVIVVRGAKGASSSRAGSKPPTRIRPIDPPADQDSDDQYSPERNLGNDSESELPSLEQPRGSLSDNPSLVNGSGLTWGGQDGSVNQAENSGDFGGKVPVPNLY
jgi:hypothetical protein